MKVVMNVKSDDEGENVCMARALGMRILPSTSKFNNPGVAKYKIKAQVPSMSAVGLERTQN